MADTADEAAETSLPAATRIRVLHEPTLMRRDEATRFLWGDEESHQVSDLVYGRGERIAALVFSLRPGEHFGMSKAWKPMYDQHRFYYVVEGQLAIHDPETGEVAVAAAGEAITWRGARYHFGYNPGSDETVVLDWYAPQERAPEVPEAAISPGKRDLREVRGGRYELLGRWPDVRPDARRAAHVEAGLVTVSERDALRVIHGQQRPLLVSILASSDVLTAGTFTLRPGFMSEPEEHPGDEVVFALDGCLHVFVPATQLWFELQPMDCLFIPEGHAHQYCAYGAQPCRVAFCVTPLYATGNGLAST
ncbi:MAG: cupin domain-containing protein [Thermoleophilia bacterium]